MGGKWSTKKHHTWCFFLSWVVPVSAPQKFVGFPFIHLLDFPFKFKFYSVVVDAAVLPSHCRNMWKAVSEGWKKDSLPSSSKELFPSYVDWQLKVRASQSPQFSHIIPLLIAIAVDTAILLKLWKWINKNVVKSFVVEERTFWDRMAVLSSSLMAC